MLIELQIRAMDGEGATYFTGLVLNSRDIAFQN
jgi:hypothetical protein